ncbi:terpene cyclase [Nocardia sp. NPDC049220]|uniref:terpene synthase family protein n=1 Tax=Nocardia sp. NPDC049220 TaxID=3155273 RepID=UPI0033E8C8F9
MSLGIAPRISSDVDQAGEHLKKWARATGMVGEGPSGDAFDAILLHRLAAWTYPYATGAELDLMADWMGWFFTFDDILDDTENGCDQYFATETAATINSIYTGVRSSPPSDELRPYFAAMEDLWRRTTDGMPADWCRRLASDMVEYVNSYRSQALINASRCTLDEPSYRTHRLISSAVYVSLDIGEVASGNLLPESLLVHPYIRIARKAATNVVAWVNDLYSAPKELSLGDLCNYLAVLQHQDGLEVEYAANRVSRHVDTQIARFHDASRHIHSQLLPQLRAEDRQSVIAMLDTCACWMSGNVAWSMETARYASRCINNALRKTSGR